MSLKLIFSIKLLSDYHVSSGFAWGKSLDSELLRDHEGIPTIRGSSLAGLFRSAASEITTGRNELIQLIDNIFGTVQKQGAWIFNSAQAVANLSRRSFGCRLFSQVKRGVRIDPKLRRAQEKKLFAREFGSSGLEFVFTVEHRGAIGKEKDEIALLVAAARMIRGFGASVNRGAGRCIISLVKIEGIDENITQDELLKHFGLMVKDEERSLRFLYTQHVEEISEECTGMVVVAQTLEPLIIADKGTTGNEYRSISYVPGTALIGALAGKYLYKYPIQEDVISYDNFVNLFRRGKVKISPLYPALKSNRQLIPSIPIPKDMLTCKYKPFYLQGHTHLEGYASCETVPTDCEICGSHVPLVSVDGFLPIDPSQKRTRLVHSRVLETHIGMRYEERRAKSEELFSYNAISSGSFFIGEIQFSDILTQQQVLSLCRKNAQGFELEAHLGKGTKRGYGKVRIMFIPSSESCINPLSLEHRIKSIANGITLTFLSDTILTDAWGRVVSEFTDDVLSDLLGMEVSVKQNFISTKEIMGFSAVSGLPCFRDIAIKAGSAVGFTLKENLDPEKLRGILAQLELSGLGFRCHEGFGVVSFNHAVYQIDLLEQVETDIRDPWHQAYKDSIKKLWEDFEAEASISYEPIKMNKQIRERTREIARWLFSHAHIGIEQLVSHLESFGEADHLQQQGIPLRKKSNMFSISFREQLKQQVLNIYEILDEQIKELQVTPREAETIRHELWPQCLMWLGGKLMMDEERGGQNG